MSSKDMIQTLIGYHYWANGQILARAAKLEPEDYFASIDYSHGSLHSLLFHMLRTEHIWRQLCQAGELTAPALEQGDFPDLEALTRHWEPEGQAMRDYIAELDKDGIESIVELVYRDGNVAPMPVWRMLLHVLLHSMQHRSEAAAVLTGYGQSPGDLDFIFYRQ